MSKIKELIKSRLNELALLELQSGEIPKQDMATTSVRLYVETIKNLDIVAGKLELSRSDIIREFLDVGVREALIELKVDPAEWSNAEYTELEGDSDE